MDLLIRVLLFIALSLGMTMLRAGDLELDCTCSYNVSGDMITLTAERVVNNRSGGTSGTLRLKLRATTTPYSGGTISGYIIGEYRFSTVLKGGFQFSDINRTVTFNEPPPGTYYITLTLTEFNDGQDFIHDYVSFSNTVIFGSGNESGTFSYSLEVDGFNTNTLLAGNTHIYSVTLSGEGTLSISSTSDLDLVGSLYDVDDDSLIAENDDGGTGLNFSISELLPAGNYEIYVLGYDSSAQGEYSIISTFTPLNISTPVEETQLSAISTSDGSSTSASFTAGIYVPDNLLITDNFTSGDNLQIVGTVIPQPEDQSRAADIFVVYQYQAITDSSSSFFYRDVSGNFIPWAGTVVDLQPAFEIESLENTEEIIIVNNALSAGSYEIFIGYMLIDGSGPIHFNSEGYKVDVKNLNDYASLGGVVINADTGQPVVNAEINVFGFISGFDNVNVYSNSKGNYFVRVFADRLQGGDTFNAMAAVEGCNQSIDYSDTINVDNHAIINFILDCEDASTTEPPTTEPPPPTTEPPTTESLSLTISSATCFVGDRFSFGAIVYNVIQVSGTASGPEGSFMNLGQGTCDSWTGTGCERLPGEPASTNWTYETTTGAWSPQSATVSLFGGNGGSRFESVTFACPTD